MNKNSELLVSEACVHVQMAISKRLNPLAALFDQAWLSLLNFAISFAFIRGTSKTEYGYYLLLLAPLLLVQNIQNAIVNSPLVTFLPAAEEKDKLDLKHTAVSLHIYLAFVMASLGMLGLAGYEQWFGLTVDGMLLVGFAFSIIGTISREAQRSFAYVQGQGIRALMGDLAYGAVLLSGLVWAFWNDQLRASIVLLLTGIAGVFPLLVKLRTFRGLQVYPKPIRQLWSCGRWALPSVVVTWISFNAYPYFAEHALGLAAVADIGAARLFLMPIGLGMTAWSNWFRPRISGWLSNGDVVAVKRITYQSLLCGWAALVVLAVLIFIAYPFIESVLGKHYVGLRSLVLMWLLFFFLSMARNICMATLMTDAQGYKILHHITWIALALSVPGYILLSSNGSLWVVGVLCGIELLQLVLVLVKVYGYWEVSARGR